MRDRGGNIYKQSCTSFTAAAVTQTNRCTILYSISHPFFHNHMDPAVSGGQNYLSLWTFLQKSRCVWRHLKQGNEMHWGRCKGVTFGKLLSSWARAHGRAQCVNTWGLCQLHFPPIPSIVHQMNQLILALTGHVDNHLDFLTNRITSNYLGGVTS